MYRVAVGGGYSGCCFAGAGGAGGARHRRCGWGGASAAGGTLCESSAAGWELSRSDGLAVVGGAVGVFADASGGWGWRGAVGVCYGGVGGAVAAPQTAASRRTSKPAFWSWVKSFSPRAAAAL